MPLPEGEAHVAAHEAVHLAGRDGLKARARLGDPRLESRETLRRFRHVGREDAAANAFDGAQGVHGGGFHLIGEGVHVLGEPGLNDLLGCDSLLGAKGLGLVEQAGNAFQYLQVRGYDGGI